MVNEEKNKNISQQEKESMYVSLIDRSQEKCAARLLDKDHEKARGRDKSFLVAIVLPGSLAATIQFPDVFTSFKSVMETNIKFVKASATESLAFDPSLMSPLRGCSPIEVADPS